MNAALATVPAANVFMRTQPDAAEIVEIRTWMRTFAKRHGIAEGIHVRKGAGSMRHCILIVCSPYAATTPAQRIEICEYLLSRGLDRGCSTRPGGLNESIQLAREWGHNQINESVTRWST